MNKNIIDKKLRVKENKDIVDLTTKNEDWKYVPLQSDINNLELGENTNLENTDGFHVNTNGNIFNINHEVDGVVFTDLNDIETPVIDESIKRPVLLKIIVSLFCFLNFAQNSSCLRSCHTIAL